jgi:hypothetical protein
VADDESLRATALDGDTRQHSRVVARAQHCTEMSLARGALVPRARGGHWLVTPEGCYLALADDLGRADPIATITHLRQRPSVVLALVWIVLGFPVVVVFVVVRRRGRLVDRAIRFVGFYVVVAALGLWHVMPALRV